MALVSDRHAPKQWSLEALNLYDGRGS
ncbi:protein of unknown function [Methylocaldum szegediense]|uniref:Uncharacterized protein n=1 Tax=Methylocaldum szegediense TaxID=73780 RepID=A0ABN8X9U4_9GAMM|nr:protein of unknown function [Methylocaldum szegediense]